MDGKWERCQWETDRLVSQPSDEDMITIGMNIRMSHERCQQIIEEVREGTRELKKYF